MMKARVCKTKYGKYIVQTKKFGLFWWTKWDDDEYFPGPEPFDTYEEAEEALNSLKTLFQNVCESVEYGNSMYFGKGCECKKEIEL